MSIQFKITLSYDDRHAPTPYHWSAEGTGGKEGNERSWIDAMYAAFAALHATAKGKADQQRQHMESYQAEADEMMKFIPDHAREKLL